MSHKDSRPSRSTFNRSSRTTSERGRPLRLESLETRVLLTINAPFINGTGTLTINAPDTPDVVSVIEATPGVVTVSIQSEGDTLQQGFNRDDFTSLKYRGGGGDDQFVNHTDIKVSAFGGEGNDVLVGGSDKDELRGEGGNDVLVGGGGNDLLIGASGDDVLQGEQGVDKLLGGDGNDRLEGGDQDDTLRGGNGSDTLIGGDGADRVDGDAGDDTIEGGAGDDTLYGHGGEDDIRGGGGNDRLDGGDDDDQLFAEAGRNTLIGGAGNDLLFGADEADELRGDGGDDVLIGGGGNDVLDGDDGNDTLGGGLGDDTISGHAGQDVLHGGGGNDTLSGGDGDDQLFASTGRNTLLGGEGNDILTGADGADVLKGNNGDDVLIGGWGNDQLDGDAGDDQLDGGAGDDTLAGHAGEDVLRGGEGDDTLSGGDENDQLFADAGRNTLLGGAGDDALTGADGSDVLKGDVGDDILIGAGGDDRLEGGAGNDVLDGGSGNDLLASHEGDDILHGGTGNDTLYGGADNDQLFADAGQGVLFGGGGDDVLTGADGADILRGNDGDDLLIGHGGDDLLEGNEGNDRLIGGEGDDTLEGAEGNDLLKGGLGDDTLVGGDGNDQLLVEGGRNTLLGGAGDDILTGANEADTLRGGPGADRLTARGGNDRLFGDSGNDLLLGGSGDDTLEGGDDNDSLKGGHGDDLLLGGGGDDVLRVDSGKNTLHGGDGDDILTGAGDDDTLRGDAGVDRLSGRGGNDKLFGDAGNDLLLGGAGDDVLEGGLDNDSLKGGVDDDLLNGGNGDDFLQVDGGNNTLIGGIGDDTLMAAAGVDTLRGGEGADRLTGGAGDDDLDGEQGADELLGGDGHDSLKGNSGNDMLDGGAGDDILLGHGGDDTLLGGTGDDILLGDEGNDYLAGEAGADTLRGNAGNDHLAGGEGNDRLFGGSGNDVLLAGEGVDQLQGEAGSDALVGGAGDDHLQSGEGNDILIGGEGRDWAFGDLGDDILIGGTTLYDENFDALDNLLARWSSGEDYAQRVMDIESSESHIHFESLATVFDDHITDELLGSSGDDYFMVTGSAGVYDPLGLHSGHDQDHSTPGGHHHSSHSGHHHSSTPILAEPPPIEGFALIDALDDVRDRTLQEVLSTHIPHADDPVKRREHISLFQLVRYQDVTHTAVASGDWSDSAIWANGVIPTQDARVLVPIGVEVTVDGVLNDPVFSIRVDGTLNYATNVDTELRVDTMIVSPTGRLEIGSAVNPVLPDVTARLRFTDTGAIDRQWDPFGVSRGLITHGSVEMHGADVTSRVALAASAEAGATTLTLSQAPTGWRVGDQIVIAGAHAGEEEVRTIQAISGETVQIAALSNDHTPFDQSLEIHVGNLTRSIVIDSEATQVARIGHTMFMHNRDVNLSNVAFENLGRTDKSQQVNDADVDANWMLSPGTGVNGRARYAVHFHRNGGSDDGNPATVSGSAVIGGPGWGFVNHSSNVNITDNVAYGVNGAAFVAEAGDEVGLFQGNLAIATTGVNEKLDARHHLQDFGQTGDGYWFQGAGVKVVDNVSAGADGNGFVYYTLGLIEKGVTRVFDATNLYDPTLGNADGTIGVNHVPIAQFTGNVAYASKVGLTVRYHLRDAAHTVGSVLQDSTFWNNTTGIDLPYSHNTTLRNMKVLHELSNLPENGVVGNDVTRDINYENLTVSGYNRGITVARAGDSIVDGGTFSNRYDIVIRPPTSNNRYVNVTGDIQFDALPEEILGASHARVTPHFDDVPVKGLGVEHLFNNNTMVLNFGENVNREIFFSAQNPSAIPFPEAKPHIPTEYVGLTSQQLLDQFGKAIGGKLTASPFIMLE